MARKETGRKPGSGEPPPVIPDKLYFRIGEVSRLLHLPSYVLRFWETEFPQLKPGKGGTGQRLYRRGDVETLIEIQRLLYAEGYTIPGARQLLKQRVRVPEPAGTTSPESEPAASALTPKLRKLRNDLQEIADMLARPLARHKRARPLPGASNPAHKWRSPANTAPTLFVLPEENGTGETEG